MRRFVERSERGQDGVLGQLGNHEGNACILEISAFVRHTVCLILFLAM
jgi:hypothetical protein